MDANIAQIIDADNAKNNAGRNISIDKVKQNFDMYVKQGGLHTVIGKVLIIFRPLQDGTIEFHTVNGGSGEDLTTSLTEFLTKLRGKVKGAVTHYDNPKINELAKYSPVPANVKKIDQGIDRTYEMTFDLKG